MEAKPRLSETVIECARKLLAARHCVAYALNMRLTYTRQAKIRTDQTRDAFVRHLKTLVGLVSPSKAPSLSSSPKSLLQACARLYGHRRTSNDIAALFDKRDPGGYDERASVRASVKYLDDATATLCDQYANHVAKLLRMPSAIFRNPWFDSATADSRTSTVHAKANALLKERLAACALEIDGRGGGRSSAASISEYAHIIQNAGPTLMHVSRGHALLVKLRQVEQLMVLRLALLLGEVLHAYTSQQRNPRANQKELCELGWLHVPYFHVRGYEVPKHGAHEMETCRKKDAQNLHRDLERKYFTKLQETYRDCADITALATAICDPQKLAPFTYQAANTILAVLRSFVLKTVPSYAPNTAMADGLQLSYRAPPLLSIRVKPMLPMGGSRRSVRRRTRRRPHALHE